MVELSTNSADPDQMPRFVASDLGLHCLPVTLLGVSSLRWVNKPQVAKGSVKPAMHSFKHVLHSSHFYR